MSLSLILLIVFLVLLGIAVWLGGEKGHIITTIVLALWMVLSHVRVHAQSLEGALERRLTVWVRPDGTRVHVKHCEQVGCTERVHAITEMLEGAARVHDVDASLLAAMALRESGLNPGAVGAAGERGVLQLHPKGKGARLRFFRSEPYRKRCMMRPDGCQKEIIDKGAELLSRSLSRCESLEGALGMYQSGRCNGARPYVGRVLAVQAKLLDDQKPTQSSSVALSD